MLLEVVVEAGALDSHKGKRCHSVLCGNIGDSQYAFLDLLYFTYSWEVLGDHTEGDTCLLAEEELVGSVSDVRYLTSFQSLAISSHA